MKTKFSELDHRSEAIERAALVSLHEGCPSDTRAFLSLGLHELEDGLVALAGADPSVLLNRALGLGMQTPLSLETLARVRRLYTDAGVERPFVHVYEHTAPPAAEAGFEKARGWRKFSRGVGPITVDARPCTLRVERVRGDAGADFGSIVAPAFGMKPEAAPLLAALAYDDRWHLYVSYDGSRPAGAGALMIEGDIGWLEWGATSPDFRQRGSQGAVMRARIEAANAAGCARLFTETGEAAPGDPQHSFRNIERYGFKAGLLRENWRPLPPQR